MGGVRESERERDGEGEGEREWEREREGEEQGGGGREIEREGEVEGERKRGDARQQLIMFMLMPIKIAAHCDRQGVMPECVRQTERQQETATKYSLKRPTML